MSQGVLAKPVVKQLRQAWKPVWPYKVQPFTVYDSSSRLVAQVKSDDFSGVAVVEAKTGKVIERVDPFTDPEMFQASGQADEEFAVWKEYQTRGADEFVVKVWDRSGKKVTQIGEGRRDPDDGHPILSPWQEPLMVDGGYAAWVESTNDDGAGDLVVVDLASGKRHVVPSAHPGWLSSYGSTLIWAESPSRGAPTELHAVDIATRKPVKLPQPLSELRGAGFLITDGKAAAWVRNDKRDVSLMVLPSMDSAPVEVKTFNANGFSPPFTLTSSTVTASVSSGGLLVLDLASGRLTIQKDASYATAAGSTFLVIQRTSEKGVKHQNAYAQVPQQAFTQINPSD